MFYDLNSYIQEQTENLCNLIENKNVQEFMELSDRTREMYKNRIRMFEKECNKSYKFLYKKL